MRVPTIELIANNFSNSTPSYTLHKEKTEAHEAFQYIEIVCNGKRQNECLFSIRISLHCSFSMVYI